MLFAIEHSTDDGLTYVQFARVLIKSINWMQIQLYGCSSKNLRHASILPIYSHLSFPNTQFISKRKKRYMKPVIQIVKIDTFNDKIIVPGIELIDNQWIDWTTLKSKHAKKLSKCKGLKFIQKLSTVERWTVEEEKVLSSSKSLSEMFKRLGRKKSLKNKKKILSKLSRMGLEIPQKPSSSTTDRSLRLSNSTHHMSLRTTIREPEIIY